MALPFQKWLLSDREGSPAPIWKSFHTLQATFEEGMVQILPGTAPSQLSLPSAGHRCSHTRPRHTYHHQLLSLPILLLSILHQGLLLPHCLLSKPPLQNHLCWKTTSLSVPGTALLLLPLSVPCFSCLLTHCFAPPPPPVIHHDETAKQMRQGFNNVYVPSLYVLNA